MTSMCSFYLFLGCLEHYDQWSVFPRSWYLFCLQSRVCFVYYSIFKPLFGDVTSKSFNYRCIKLIDWINLTKSAIWSTTFKCQKLMGGITKIMWRSNYTVQYIYTYIYFLSFFISGLLTCDFIHLTCLHVYQHV